MLGWTPEGHDTTQIMSLDNHVQNSAYVICRQHYSPPLLMMRNTMMSSTLTQWLGLYSAHPRPDTRIKTHLQVNVIVGEGCQELSLIDTGASDTPIL